MPPTPRRQASPSTTSTTTPEYEPPTGIAGPGGSTGAASSALSAFGNNSLDPLSNLLDVTAIFGSPAIPGQSRRRILMSGTDLNQLMANPSAKLRTERNATGDTVSIVRAGVQAVGAPNRELLERLGPNGKARSEGLLRVQYMMRMTGAYASGVGGPVLGTWSDLDTKALTLAVTAVLDANFRTGANLDLGKYLKDQTQKAIALAADAAGRARSTRRAPTISVTDSTAVGSQLDQAFRELTGRSASAGEKDKFIKAFRADEMSAGYQRAGADDVPSVEQQTVTAMDDLRGEFALGKADPLVKHKGVYQRASKWLDPADRAAIAKKNTNVNYSAIAEFYARNPQMTNRGGGGGGGGGVVVQPSLGGQAEAAAKASPDYMPYQIGSRGMAFLRMLKEPGYQVNPDVRTG